MTSSVVAPVVARPRLQTAGLLQQIVRAVSPQGVIWISPDVPAWVLARPGLRLVITSAPPPGGCGADLVWIEHDLTWLASETVDAIKAALAGREAELDFAWIDGHHALHVLLSHLRAVTQLNGEALVAFDDVVPPDMTMAGEHWGASDWWVGEVWKLFAWLRRRTSGALVRAYDTESTGMGVLQGLSGRMLAGLDSDAIRREVAELTDLSDVRTALDLADGRDAPRELAQLAARSPSSAGSLRFVALEELRSDSAVRVTDLAIGGPFLRPPAECVAEFSDEPNSHHLGAPWMTELSTVARVTLPEGSIVRGTLMVELLEGRLFLPRVARDDMTAAFTDQVRAQRDPMNSSSHFFSGLNWNSTGRPVVEETFVRDVEGDVLWATPDEWDNWGTWLLQTLPAIVDAESNDYDGRLLCRVARPWQHHFLKAMAPRMYGRLVPQDVECAYRVAGRTTVVAQELRNFATTLFERTLLTEVVERALFARPEPTPERIFISRLSHSQRHPTYRALLNEPELLASLQALGFVAVEPERMDLIGQIVLFARAREIVGLGGAGMFNAVFCRPGASILDIESSTNWVEGHANLFASSGLRYGVVLGRRVAEDSGPHARWTVPVDETLAVARRFFGNL